MRLLNSICNVISSAYAGKPVHIAEVPKGFMRDCFLVTLATSGSNILSKNVYEDDPVFQIVYFGVRDEANQVVADNLYQKKEELKALFLLRRVVPVLSQAGVVEKPRYAKIETYTDEVRLNEGALYVKITLNFTEDLPNVDTSEPIEDVDLETSTTVD